MMWVRTVVLGVLLWRVTWSGLSHAQPMPEAEPEQATVVVVGAGVAGLVAGYQLQKRGVKVVVLESYLLLI